MISPDQSALKKGEKRNDQHLSPKPDFYEPGKTPDHKNNPIKVQN